MASFQYGGLIEQVTVTANSGGTTNLTSTSKQIQVFTGSTGQTVVLPNATTYTVAGAKFEIYNESSASLTIQFYGGAGFSDGGGISYSSLAPHSSLLVKLQTNSTSAGVWTALPSAGPASTTYLNVKTYGATGNGSTDDTTAIQNALNAVSSSNATVYFPAGTYIISTNLTPQNNTTMLGDGAGRTIIQTKSGQTISTTTETGMIQGNDLQNFTLREITLNGGGSWTSTPFPNPYNPPAASGTLTYVSGTGPGTITYSSWTLTSNQYVFTITSASVTSGAVYTASNGRAFTVVTTISPGTTLTTTSNSVGFTNSDIGVKPTHVSAGFSNIVIENCEMTGLGYGTYFNGSATDGPIHITGCNIHNCGTGGIVAFLCSELFINGNIVSGVFGNLTAANDTSIADSKFCDGIYFGSCVDFICNGNYVTNFTRCGIIVEPDGPNSTRMVVSNNDISNGNAPRGGQDAAGIYIGDGFSAAPIQISDNVIYNIAPSNNGTGIIAESYCNITGGAITGCQTGYGSSSTGPTFITGVDLEANKYGVQAANTTSGNTFTIKACNISLNTICGILLYESKGYFDICDNTFQDNGSASSSALGNWSAIGVVEYFNAQTLFIHNNTFISSANQGATSGQLYSILAYEGGDFEDTTAWVQNNNFLFTGTFSNAYPTNLGVLPVSYGLTDGGGTYYQYEIGSTSGNQNSKMVANSGTNQQFAYLSGFPGFLGFASTAPSSGTYRTGDYFQNNSLASGQPFIFMCTSGGTPGTWQSWGGTLYPALTGDVTSTLGSSATTVAKIQGTAVSGTTGSGNVVLSASPTITGSPIIGSGGDLYFENSGSAAPGFAQWIHNSNTAAVNDNVINFWDNNVNGSGGSTTASIRWSHAANNFQTTISLYGADSGSTTHDIVDFNGNQSVTFYGSVTIPAIDSNATQTTITGTAGSIVASMPHQGSSYKKVVLYLSGYTNNGTQNYNYPVLFSHTPVAVYTASGASLTISTSEVSVVSTAVTGFVILEGF